MDNLSISLYLTKISKRDANSSLHESNDLYKHKPLKSNNYIHNRRDVYRQTRPIFNHLFDLDCTNWKESAEYGGKTGDRTQKHQ